MVLSVSWAVKYFLTTLGIGGGIAGTVLFTSNPVSATVAISTLTIADSSKESIQTPSSSEAGLSSDNTNASLSPAKVKELDEGLGKYYKCRSRHLHKGCKSYLPSWFVNSTNEWT
ncbi:hypothetical protein OVS_04000 [Mycoplasma ovis str. Michigan]|uniref:Uncharacterized protein n=1 Tax=Mycoplasma ovis str. Michigan TaxID=1415773 RepID=A0ABN4BNF7_9MOLU|nr:hypothetical protein [Mycoplasma ovis]AHC40531.1 hypothetical protein OVS_04000 [Mycoplasma ovis str. Michigan]